MPNCPTLCLTGILAAALLVGAAVSPERAFAQSAASSIPASNLSPSEKLYSDLAKLAPDQREKRLEDGARKEGALSVVHTLRGKLAANHLALFEKRYPFIKLDATIDLGSQDGAERMLAEEGAGRHLTDVLTAGRPDLTELLDRNLLARYPTPASNAILPRYRKLEDIPLNRWTVFYWSEHGISYNTNLVPPDKVPKTWMGLCDPFFKGSVSFDPAETRFLSGIYDILGMEGYEKFVRCIGANQPIIQRGHDQRMELMLAGDHMIQGDNYLYYGLYLKKKNPSLPLGVDYNVPLIASTGVDAINRNTPHPYAAALFVDWTLSHESQQYLADLYRGPVTQKHPFLPDNATLVENVSPPPPVAKKILALWREYVEKRR